MNWYRCFVVAFGIFMFIAGYEYGLWNSIKAAGLVFAAYQFGRFSYERDVEVGRE